MLVNQVRRFGETLVDRHVLSRDTSSTRSTKRERTGQPLPAVLLRLGLVGAKDLTAALADQHRHAASSTSSRRRSTRTRRRCSPPTDGAQALALPVDFEDRKLVVAFAEPADDDAVAAIGAATGYEIIPAVADRDELAQRDRHDLRRRDRETAPTGVGAPTPRSIERSASRARRAAHQRPARARASSGSGSDLHLTVGLAAGRSACTATCARSRDMPDAQRLADPPDGVLDPHAEAAGEVRERARARHLVRAARARAASASTCSCSATPSAA